MPQENKGTTYSFDVCSLCKSICCHDAKPPLTGTRKKAIAKHLKKQKINLLKPFTKENYSYPSVDEHVYCRLFNKQTGRCMVHQVKPETCVAGPVTFDINIKSKKVEWFLKKSEICAYAGILFSDKPTFEQHFVAAKKQILQLITELEGDELRALMKIDEPLTFKIGEDDLPIQVSIKLGL